ncbi:MAG TPA: Gfo/Idh/MocA family oxidoreductase [Pseudonocardia sp.]|nr:Gfo/Idh/MocA family oxidoreductase [Pseudonocardia sp.]
MNIGILGTASIAWRKMLPALMEAPDVHVTAIAGRSPERTAEFVARFGGEPVTGYAALLDRPDVDAVYLPLPNALHHRWAAEALRAGKHVLVEKPLTTSVEHTAELLELADRHALVLRENFTFLHHPMHASVRRLLDEGRFGQPRTLTGSFCFPPLPATDVRYRPELGGGALLDAGVYPLRWAQWLLGDDLEVAGAVLRVDADTGVDLSGSALLTSPGGVTVCAEFGFEHSYGSRYRLWGSDAQLVVDRAFSPPPAYQPVLRIDEQDHAEEIVLPAANQFARSAAAFVAAIRRAGAGGPANDPAERAATLRTAQLVDHILGCARTVPVPATTPTGAPVDAATPAPVGSA